MHNRDRIRVRNLRRAVYMPKQRDESFAAFDYLTISGPILHGKKGKLHRQQQQRARESSALLTAETTTSDFRKTMPSSNDQYGGRQYGVRQHHQQPHESFHQTNYCYSCMNAEFLDYWPLLQKTYVRPANFSDSCLTMPSRVKIGFVHCETSCVSIKEQRITGGSPNGFNVVRGCLATVTRYQLPAYVYALSRRNTQNGRQFCQNIETADLYSNWQDTKNNNNRNRRKMIWVNDDNQNVATSGDGPKFRIQLCTCTGHLCNNGRNCSSGRSRWILYLCLMLVCMRIFINCDAQDVARNIRAKIFENYNKNLLPVANKSKSITLSAKMHFFHVDRLNEKEQSVTLHGVFQMSWTDEFLKWDPSQYNETKFILLKNIEIWTPQIVLANAAKQSSIDYFWNLPVKVWHTGAVYASPEFTYDVSCVFDFTKYPNDVQTCPMAFFANGMSISEMNWTLILEPELHLFWPNADQKLRVSKWKIVGTDARVRYWSQGGLKETNKRKKSVEKIETRELPRKGDKFYFSEAPNKTMELFTLSLAEMSISFKRNDVYFPLTIMLPALLTSLITLTALLPFLRLKNSLLLLLVNFLLQSFYADNLLEVLPPSLASMPRIMKFYTFNFCCTTAAILLRIWLLFMQIQKSEQKLVEKRIAAEASNQERLPQDGQTPAPLPPLKARLTQLLEPKTCSHDMCSALPLELPRGMWPGPSICVAINADFSTFFGLYGFDLYGKYSDFVCMISNGFEISQPRKDLRSNFSETAPQDSKFKTNRQTFTLNMDLIFTWIIMLPQDISLDCRFS
uniref:Neurotransmitter-gated ion-channel ligand-binding domain-containing protein n=1 Tax=Romanomermis culicivorax TaxID=13658 RepID=A0A915HUP4_ROMCU